MKQKTYSEHCPKHATTQPSSNSSSFAISDLSAEESSSDLQQQRSNLDSSKVGIKGSTAKSSSKTSKTKITSKKDSATTAKTSSNQIASGKTSSIPKSFSFSSFLYNRNANKNKSIVQKQQSENPSSASYFAQNNIQQLIVQREHANVFNHYQNIQNIQQQNVATSTSKLIKHSTSMDSITPYQIACPKHGIYQYVDNQMIENFNLISCSKNKKLKTTYSLHSIQNLDDEELDNLDEIKRCKLHYKQQDKSSQTEERTNLNENNDDDYYSNLNQINKINNFQHQQHLPFLKNLPPAHSLPPTYHLPPTSLKSSSSFPSPQSSSSTTASCHSYLHYHHHYPISNQQAVAPFLNEIDQANVSGNFYTNFMPTTSQHHHHHQFIQQSTSANKATTNTSNAKKTNQSNQVNLNLILSSNLQSTITTEQQPDQFTSNSENYYEREQPSFTSESTGGTLNATTGYSLGELEEEEECNFRLGEGEILKEEEAEEKEYLEQDEIENDLHRNKHQQLNDKTSEQEKLYFLSFKNNNKNNNLQNNHHFMPVAEKSLKREEAIKASTTLRERNNNEILDYQLNSQVNDMIREEERIQQNAGIRKQRPEISNLSELTIKKSKDFNKAVQQQQERWTFNNKKNQFFIKQQSSIKDEDDEDNNDDDEETNKNADNATKKRLRDSASTDSSSLINEEKKKIKTQETKSVKRKRNWFFQQISNSSKSYCTSSSTNCDTCSIITNQDTDTTDNIFNEKLTENDNKFNETTSTEQQQQSTTAFNLLNQTRNKFAQLRSQIRQQHSNESDQSVLTTTTISLTGASSRNLSRQASQSSFSLKNLFHKKKKRLSGSQTDQINQQQQRKSAENLNSNNNKDSKQTQQQQQQQFKKDKHHIRLKSKHCRTLKLTANNKHKCIGGIKSKPLKQIIHPLERSVSSFIVVTLFFSGLAFFSGFPIVCLLCLCLPFAVAIRNLITCDFRTSYSEHRCTPAEHYWLNSSWKNNCKKGQAVCLIMVDSGFTLEQCRDLIQSRLIQKVGTERFRWILRYKGMFIFDL